MKGLLLLLLTLSLPTWTDAPKPSGYVHTREYVSFDKDGIAKDWIDTVQARDGYIDVRETRRTDPNGEESSTKILGCRVGNVRCDSYANFKRMVEGSK